MNALLSTTIFFGNYNISNCTNLFSLSPYDVEVVLLQEGEGEEVQEGEGEEELLGDLLVC